MRKLCVPILTLVLAAPITFMWDYNYLTPACDATRTTDCVSGFRIYDVTVSPPALLATAPNPTNAVGAVIGIEYTVNSFPHLGNSSAVAVATFVDWQGQVGETADSNTVIFQVKSEKPSSLRVQ